MLYVAVVLWYIAATMYMAVVTYYWLFCVLEREEDGRESPVLDVREEGDTKDSESGLWEAAQEVVRVRTHHT